MEAEFSLRKIISLMEGKFIFTSRELQEDHVYRTVHSKRVRNFLGAFQEMEHWSFN